MKKKVIRIIALVLAVLMVGAVLINLVSASDGSGHTKSDCKVCGVCPIQPFGVCLFVWVGGAFVLFMALFALSYFILPKRTTKIIKRAKRR